MAKTFGRLPQEVARPLVPELAGVVSAYDWYAFDVAGALRLEEMRREQEAAVLGLDGAGDGRGRETTEDHRLRSRRHRRRPPGPPRQSGPVATESGQELSIRGTEVPPWER